MSKTKSIYTEQSVLGGLMMDNSHFNQVSQLITAQDFTKQSHRVIPLAS